MDTARIGTPRRGFETARCWSAGVSARRHRGGERGTVRSEPGHLVAHGGDEQAPLHAPGHAAVRRSCPGQWRYRQRLPGERRALLSIAGHLVADGFDEYARYWGTATLVPDGGVLVIGGCYGDPPHDYPYLAEAEIYAPPAPGEDATAPDVSCGAADGAWHSGDVAIACAASDPGSGLANAANASFTLITHVAIGTDTADAATDSRQVCDNAGNCATAGPITGNKVDKKAPAVSCVHPTAPGTTAMSSSPAQRVISDHGWRTPRTGASP